MGCGGSRRSRVAPEPAGAARLADPDDPRCIHSWAQLIALARAGDSPNTDAIAARLAASLTWVPDDVAAVRAAMPPATPPPRGDDRLPFLSPRLRAQLWVALSRVDERACDGPVAGAATAENSQSPQPENHGFYWGKEWYADAVARADEFANGDANETTKAFTVIANDVPRTLHNFDRFTYPKQAAAGRLVTPAPGLEEAALSRVLRAFAVLHPDVNYTQGMNFVAALCLRVLWFGGCDADSDTDGGKFGPGSIWLARREERACGMLRVLAGDMGLAELWRVGFPLLHEISDALVARLGEREPKVAARLKKDGLPPSSFTTSWLITLFTSGPELKLCPEDLLCWWDLLWVECRCAEALTARGPAPWSAAASTYLLRSSYDVLLCHGASIAAAKDVVGVMAELRRPLTRGESARYLFARDGGGGRPSEGLTFVAARA